MKKISDSTTIGEARKAGRLGDDQLVHLNKAEVQMLEDMTYGHGLTVNPATGHKEAFLPFLLSALPSLIPGLGASLAGMTGMSFLANPAILGAIGSGLGTAIETGDVGKGIMAGLGGAALGGLAGNLAGGAGTALAPEAAKGVAQAGTALGNVAAPGTMQSGLAGALQSVGGNAVKQAAIAPQGMMSGLMNASIIGAPGAYLTAQHQAELAAQPTEAQKRRQKRIEDAQTPAEALARTYVGAPAGYNPGFDPEWNYFRYANGGLVDILGSVSPAFNIINGLTGGDFNPMIGGLLPAILDYNRPGTPESRAKDKATKGYASGGYVETTGGPMPPAPASKPTTVDPSPQVHPWWGEYGGVPVWATKPGAVNPNVPFTDGPMPALPTKPVPGPTTGGPMPPAPGGGSTPVGITPRPTLTPGGAIGDRPVFNYANQSGVVPGGAMGTRPTFGYANQSGVAPGGAIGARPSFGQTPIIPMTGNTWAQPRGLWGGLDPTTPTTPTTPVTKVDRYQPGELIRDPAKYGPGTTPTTPTRPPVVTPPTRPPVGPNDPTTRVGGGGGRDRRHLFSEGGYVGGSTDGMSDQIMAMIDGAQPAALSSGEFVIPADAVSALGNGNSEAGAERLQKMIDQIRMAKTGSKKQPKPI